MIIATRLVLWIFFLMTFSTRTPWGRNCRCSWSFHPRYSRSPQVRVLFCQSSYYDLNFINSVNSYNAKKKNILPMEEYTPLTPIMLHCIHKYIYTNLFLPSLHLQFYFHRTLLHLLLYPLSLLDFDMTHLCIDSGVGRRASFSCDKKFTSQLLVHTHQSYTRYSN